MDSLERHRNIFFAGPEEAAHAHDQGNDPTGFIDENVFDIADLVFIGIVDVLLVPVGNRHRLARKLGLNLRGGIIVGGKRRCGHRHRRR